MPSAARFALARTGLAGLTPRDVWDWVGRVRDGRLSPAEAAITLGLLYRLWLVACLLKAIGSGWDVAWHFQALRDDLAPPHLVNLTGDVIMIALILFFAYTRFGVDRWALRLMIIGAVLFVGSAPIDVINHRLNGLDITSWSPTHLGLYAGTGIMYLGALRGWHLHSRGRGDRALISGALWLFFLENVWFPNQHQEYGIESIAAWDRGATYAQDDLLNFAAAQMGRGVDRDMVVAFSLPVGDWVYPVWTATAAALVLVLARHFVGWRFTATAIAAGYIAWRCVAYPILFVTSYPTSAVPFLLLAVGLAVDLVFLLHLRGLAQAAVGAMVVTTVAYVAAFVQGYVLVAPPISYQSSAAAAAILFAAWAVTNTLVARSKPALVRPRSA